MQRCCDPPLLEEYAALLADGERARWRRFVFERDRHAYLVSRALLRVVLARYVDQPPATLAFGAGPHGKPFLLGGQGGGSRLSFNLSHTEGLAVVAVAGGCDVGVDVENLGRRAPLEVAHTYFHPAEAQALAACDGAAQVQRFWELWTLKEAYLKATGLGLSLPFDAFRLDLDARGEVALHLADARAPAGRWWLGQWMPQPGYLLALCVRPQDAASPEVRLRDTVPLRSAQDLLLSPTRRSRT